MTFQRLFVVHPSLLPKYRGASPIHYALLNGDTETGVSVAGVSPKKFDAGTVYLQTRVTIDHSDTYGSLVKKLAAVGGELALKMARGEYPSGGLFKQNEADVTKAPKFDEDANQLCFSKVRGQRSAQELSTRTVFNMCRTFKGSSHGYLKFTYKGNKVGFEDLSLIEDSELDRENHKIADSTQRDCVQKFARNLPVGSLHLFKNVQELKGFLAIRLKDGFLLAKKVTYEGLSRTVSVGEFVKEIGVFGGNYPNYITMVIQSKQPLANEENLKHAVLLD